MNASMYDSFRHQSLYDSPQKHNKIEPRRMESFRKSVRKPIFENSFYYSSNKKGKLTRPMTITQPTFHHISYQQAVHDDFCGCEHNLEPCSIIKQLLVNLSEKDMRKQYEQLQKSSGIRSKFELRKKYFKYLPSYYPQIYHAQLANILANIQEELTYNEFITLAWIQYHSKYEHLTYFLFCDLKKAQKPKKKFFDNLQLSLISHEVDFNSLIQESKACRIPLLSFLEHYHQTIGANIIPLSQYGKFVKILLKKGYKLLTLLLIQLLTSKKQTLFEILKHYSSGTIFREKSRALLWEHFFEELEAKKGK